MSAVIDVKWNGKKFPIEFRNARELETTTVKELKANIQRMTGIADTSLMRLIAFGAVMNNDDMPLSVYGLRPGCFISLKLDKSNKNHHKEGHKHQHQHQHQEQAQDLREPAHSSSNKQHEHKKHNHHHHHNKQPAPTADAPLSGEAKLLQDLQVIKYKLDTEIIPQFKKYETDVKEFLTQKHEDVAKEKKKHLYMGSYLGEQLMHVFFELDAFVCGPDNLNARQMRKELVKTAQSLLEKVDEIKSLVKNVVVPAEADQ